MHRSTLFLYALVWVALGGCIFMTREIPKTYAQDVEVATTTLTISICGDAIINSGEACDVPGETGVYSTTIAGRQCNAVCQYGPYCGDAILQIAYDEECDDGNNTDGDFCAADCTVEHSAGGGGGSKGSGGGSSGGSNDEGKTTEVSISGKAYPNSTVNILLDGDVIGTVRADSNADFTYSTDVEPGTNSFGFWANDSRGVRSITLNTTFDVTQSAITNITGILLPPTISIDRATVSRGESVTFSGKSVPNAAIATHIDGNKIIETTTSNATGDWSLIFNTNRVSEDEHSARPKLSIAQNGRSAESNYGQTLAFFVGVNPTGAISSSDLNRDGKVNLIDFSILIFWWGTDGGNSNPKADINGNGKVGLEDFSILLFNWTG